VNKEFCSPNLAHSALFGGCDSCVVVSVTTMLSTTGWPSATKERWLLGNFVKSDNSIRCIAVSMRRREYPRTITSCMAKTSRRTCSLPSRLSSAKAKSSCGSSNDCSGDISMRTACAWLSFAQHSGDFVLIFLRWLTVAMMAAGNFPPDKVVSSSTAKAKQIPAKAIPDADHAARSNTGCKFHRQRPMA